jgi:hypothetical protein
MGDTRGVLRPNWAICSDPREGVLLLCMLRWWMGWDGVDEVLLGRCGAVDDIPGFNCVYNPWHAAM